MTPEEHDKPVRELIARLYLPPDVCPSDPKDIEALLESFAGKPLSEDQVERMLKKARGELPVGDREGEEPQWSEEALSEQERELVALHKNESGRLPPEIEEKLRRLREKAKAKAREKEEDHDDDLES
jgi:hypothetical protein